MASMGKKVLAVDFTPSSMMLSAVDSKLRMEMGEEKMLASIHITGMEERTRCVRL